jgi:hypothetical protein
VPKDVAGFTHLSLPAALEVMQNVTPQEKQQFLRPLVIKLRQELGKLPPAEQRQVIEQLNAAHITSADLLQSVQH